MSKYVKPYPAFGFFEAMGGVNISYISYNTDTGNTVKPLLIGERPIIEAKFSQLLQWSNSYDYAEQTIAFSAVTHWRNSWYEIGDNVNNSNTFVKYALSSNQIPYSKMNGSHPGRDVPLPVNEPMGNICIGAVPRLIIR